MVRADESPKTPKLPWYYNFALAARGAIASGCRRAELLNDGNADNFDGGNGYAETDWAATPPQFMLVILPQAQEINTVRFLLWNQDPRFYRYKLEISAAVEGEAWILIADKSTTGEYRGWQTITFPAQPVRRVRLTGTYNSVNNGFHVVELQLFNIPDNFTPHWDEKESDKPNAAPATGTVSAEF